MPDPIFVHDLVQCSICPMQVYLSHPEPREFVEPQNYSIAKQIACHLGEPLNEEEIWEELLLILPDAGETAHARLREMIALCTPTAWPRAAALDVSVHSKKYGVTGRVDRLFDDGFAVVRSCAAPAHGIYANDRLRLTACGLCLAEEHDRGFFGTVEYLGSGTIRTLPASSPGDRRAFLSALRVAENIARGEIPRSVRGTHCPGCRFHERCKEIENPKSLFDKLRRFG